MGISFLAIVLVVFVVFLVILAGLSLAVTKTVNPDGRVSRGFFGGIASAIAVIFLCAVALAGTGIFTAALLIGVAVDKNPIQRIEVRRATSMDEAADAGGARTVYAAESAKHPVSVRFSVAGEGGGNELLSFLEDVVGVDRRQLEDALTIKPHESGVSNLEVYEFRLPLSPKDLDDFERQIERDLEGVNVRLPESITIFFEGAEE